MSKVSLMNYLENTRKVQEAEQAIYEEMKEAILTRLRQREGVWVKYWDFRDEIYKEELVPQDTDGNLEGFFSRYFKVAIERLHSEKIIYKSWQANTGGIVIFPYEDRQKGLMAAAKAEQEFLKSFNPDDM